MPKRKQNIYLLLLCGPAVSPARELAGPVPFGDPSTNGHLFSRADRIPPWMPAHPLAEEYERWSIDRMSIFSATKGTFINGHRAATLAQAKSAPFSVSAEVGGKLLPIKLHDAS
jgi:hypothetical protein